YPRLLAEVRGGATTGDALRAELAAKAFRAVAEYDREIDRFFATHVAPGSTARSALPPEAAQLLQGDLPRALEPLLSEGRTAGGDGEGLRYGENPHQRGFLLRGRPPGEASVLHARVLAGKQLSYNNLLDADAALELVKEFETSPAAAII